MLKKAEIPSEQAMIEYLRRSYTAVDGLWFVKVEETDGFDTALELDRQVWQVMGKIQARAARKILGLDSNDLDALAAFLRLKFFAENYQAEILRPDPATLEISLTRCPWVEILKKTGRLHLAKTIANLICRNESEAWAKEFGQQVHFSADKTLCGGYGRCYVRFEKSEAD